MDPILEMRGLTVEAASASGRVRAVDGVDLCVSPGDVVGIIGESGSGKTTLVRSIIGLLERNVEITAGHITFDGREVLGPSVEDLASIRGSGVGMVFQSALTSLNPLLTVGTQMREVLSRHQPEMSKGQRRDVCGDVLRRMELPDPDAILSAYPHQLSGGQRQRAAIAIAIVTSPQLVIADECTSALDVTTQAEVVDLLRRLADEQGTALLFVTHDLLLAAELCTRIAVMYGGQVVETGTTAEVLDTPRHPYTRALLRSVPTWEVDGPLRGIPGTPPRVAPDTIGCRFADRCAYVVDACRAEDVPLIEPDDRHDVRCILPDGLPIDDALRRHALSRTA